MKNERRKENEKFSRIYRKAGKPFNYLINDQMTNDSMTK